MTSMANCNFCASCIKACQKSSLRRFFRKPTSELWFLARPKFAEAFLAVVIVGIVLVQNITMLSFWEPLMQTLQGVLLGSRVAAFTSIFLVAMGVPFLMMAAVAYLTGAQTGESIAKTFARFGYAVIPLDLAGHMAHNFFHLFAEGKAVAFNTAALFDVYVTGSLALFPTSTIQALQFGVLGLGIAGSIFTAYKITQRSAGRRGSLRAFLPQLIVLVIFGLVNVYLFTLPMSHRV